MKRWIGWFLAAPATVVGLGMLTSMAEPFPEKPHAPHVIEPIWSLTGECRALDFKNIDIQWYGGRGTYVLTVSGIKPYTNMEVSLSHKGYAARPAYWQTVVVGCVKNFLVMPIPSPYYVTMPLDRFVGTRGVEIIGASRSIRRNVPKPR